MTHTLVILALTTASRALQDAHDVLVAAGYRQAAAHVHQAGQLVASAMGLVIVDTAQRRTS